MILNQSAPVGLMYFLRELRCFYENKGLQKKYAEGHKKAAGLLFFLGLLVTYSNQPDKKQVALGSGVMVRYKKTRKELGEDAVRRSFLLSKRADEAPLNLENLSSVERFVIKCLGSGVVQWVALSLLAGLIIKENSGQIRSVADAAKRSVVDFAASENIKSFSS